MSLGSRRLGSSCPWSTKLLVAPGVADVGAYRALIALRGAKDCRGAVGFFEAGFVPAGVVFSLSVSVVYCMWFFQTFIPF